MDQPLRLVLVDDHQIVLDGLRSMLRPHARAVTVVAVATDADAALAAVAEHFPDVVLLDVRLGNDSGLEVCERILERSPEQAGRVPHRVRR